jgi:hypothetical protein
MTKIYKDFDEWSDSVMENWEGSIREHEMTWSARQAEVDDLKLIIDAKQVVIDTLYDEIQELKTEKERVWKAYKYVANKKK